MRVLRVIAVLLSLMGYHLLAAQTTQGSQLQGRVTTPSGVALSGVRVTVLNQGSGVSVSLVTGPDGTYTFSNLAPGGYLVSAEKAEFTATTHAITLQGSRSLSLPIKMTLASVSESVTVTAGGAAETSVTEATISKQEIEGVAGPFGSAAQALTAAPGVFVYGYGGVAATARSEVVIRGVKGGWSSVNGDVQRNAISFLFDGIPMNNMIANNGQWQTTQIPIMDMISNIAVDYGPGAPSNRWFDSVGGTVNYVPVQPSTEHGFTMTGGADYGSYNTHLEHFVANTGMYKGWSGVLAAGYAANDTFRTGTIGNPTFTAPSSGYSTFAKMLRVFDRGDFSVGYYHGRNTEYRPNFVPLTPISENGDAVTTTGLYGVDAAPSTPIPPDAQLYSQPTSGFYSSLAKDVWFKQIKTQSDIVYAKLQVALAQNLNLDASSWYRHGYRLHNRVVNYYGPLANTHSEWYDPSSNEFGDRAVFSTRAPHNDISFGGYLMHGMYHSKVALFNPNLGTSKDSPSFFNAFKMHNDYGFLFVQDRIDMWHQKISITPGLAEQMFRTSFFNTGLSEFPNSPPANDPELAADASKNFSKLSPSVGAQYHAIDWLTLHGNFAITYQNPTDGAFGANRSAKSVDLNALKAVKSANSEAGLLVTKCPAPIFGTCSLDATFYHEKLTNETVIVQFSNTSVPATFSLASAAYNGVSINFDEAPNRFVQVHGNAIVQHDYFLSYVPGGSTTNFASYPISNTPKYTTNLGLTSLLKADDKGIVFTPGLWWQYVGTRYLFSNVTSGPTKQTSPGYGVVNLNMDASLDGTGRYFSSLPSWMSKIPLKLSLGVENLFNKEYNPTAYITSGGYFGTSFGGYTLVDPGAPREYIGSLNINLK
ncbi:TonB-dependent receptor [Acidipila rosea]|uniref:Iron complex outermembrane receptor protein n=1 Tax=Acidipila rosea TaxID=768535 RepID=A0A4R1L9T0_9BACT|nr:TonB-dependent receptor [Acidipila rosea]TCK74127.1 iron complex outermembrane receptor protein [Acidipila rosea]